MEHETQVTVSDIEQRLTATREDLDATERALAAIPEKKESLLGAAHFDDEALAKVETKEAGLNRKQESLMKRLPLLEKQLEEAEAHHAHARIAELVTETATLRAAFDAQLAAFQQDRERAHQSAEKLVDLHRAMHILWEEQEYLVERFIDFGVEPGALTDAGEMPDHERESQTLYEGIRLWTMSRSIGSVSEWGHKTRAILDERSRRANPNPSGFVPGHIAVGR